jgi:DNA primase
VSWKGLLPRTISDADFVYDLKREVLCIPYKKPDGSVFRWRERDNSKGWWSKGEALVPYGLETLCNGRDAARSCLCVCEGESDTLALREALRGMVDDGWQQWIYVIGCPGANLWSSPAWDKYVQPWDHVVVLGDGDRAGKSFVNRTRELISLAGVSCIGWTMPDNEDVRSIIQTMGADELLREVKRNVELVELFTGSFPVRLDPA